MRNFTHSIGFLMAPFVRRCLSRLARRSVDAELILLAAGVDAEQLIHERV